MHEFVPRITRSISISKLRKCLAASNLNLRHHTSSPKPENPPNTPSFDRIFPSPPLRRRQNSSWLKEHLLSFEAPKRPNSVNSVHKIYYGISERARGYNKMKCWVQFLSTPTADTPGTTLLLHFDSKRYLIGNVAEGTQRAAVQRKVGLIKVGDIFLTGPTNWARTGGLLGMVLTLADAVNTSFNERMEKEALKGKKKAPLGEKDSTNEKRWLNIHGGENLTHTLATARRFIFRQGRPLFTNEFRSNDPVPEDWEATYKDDLVKVWAMVIDPETRSPRKRSHEEFANESVSEPITEAEVIDGEQKSRNDQMRKGIVSDMFDSDWRLDALVKKKLSEVQRPTTIFHRDKEGKIVKYSGPTLDEDPSVEDIEVLIRNPWPGALVEDLPPTRPSTSSVCYIIKNHPQRGKFNPGQAKALGVKPGADFRKLTEGNNITTADGNVVTPDMVLSEGKEGGGFAIVELPDESYVAPLLARNEWSSEKVMGGVEIVVWILGPDLNGDPRLLKFMKDRSDLKHVVSSQDCCSNYLALESVASAAMRLHMFDPERFPVPKYSHEVKPPKDNEPRPYEKARLGMTLQLEPRVEIQDNTIVPYLNTEGVVTAFKKDSQDIIDLADAARKTITSPEYEAELEKNQADIPSKDAEVFTLGTGSALPSKYRNVSATLLRVPGFGSYLFDAGENTLGQLKRVLGDELPTVLRDLKAIWISHLHADHHLGTASVIKAWSEETKKDDSTKDNKLVLASHKHMLKWLQEYAQVEDFGFERLLPVSFIAPENTYRHFSKEEQQKYGLTGIHACWVEHCYGALAVVFKFPNGFKVAYSGDCRPSDRFVQIGQGATLLIHEATFDDELQGDAYAKKHSTTSEALGVGRRMKARRILLTHFSQRYQKIPVMDSHGGKDQVAIVAFDYMRCKIEDFVKLEAFKPALVKLYEKKESKEE